MLRVVRSSVQGLDIDDDLADEYEEAIDKALNARDQVRETYSLDAIGQKEYHFALLPYTDPTGAFRWAILESAPATYECQDTDDVEEAIATYEEWVRAWTESAMPSYDDEGNEKPLWDESDVEGVAAETLYDGNSGNLNARMQDAEWAHEAITAVEEAYQQATQRRQVAFARLIDSWGRGGQTVLAKRVDLSEPTVKAIADKGRQILQRTDLTESGVAVWLFIHRDRVQEATRKQGGELLTQETPPLVPMLGEVVPFSADPLPVTELAAHIGPSGPPVSMLMTLAAAWALMQQPTLVERTRETAGKAEARSAARAGLPVPEYSRVDLRRQFRPQEQDPDDGGGSRHYRYRWVVSGHWRTYRSDRFSDELRASKRWIPSYVKGPEGAPLLSTEKVNVWRR